MQNFNTYQTRHFYVAGAIDSSVDTNLDIALKTTATGEMFFAYRNADGLLTRSDTFDPKKIVSLKKTTSAQMARPLMAHTVAVNTSVVTLANLVGKTLDCIITIHGLFDYDDSNSVSYVASVTGNSTNTASATAFHKALAEAIAAALPKGENGFPLIHVYSNGTEVHAGDTATGAAGGVILVEGLQKYVRGKLSGEPCHFSVAFRFDDSQDAWGTDTIAPAASPVSPIVYPANYILADLEYFALGERGDMYRGFNWPNNYEPTYAINPNSGTYSVLTIEYYWQGGAENVQKSPRMIQVAAPETQSNDIVTTLYNSIFAETQDGIESRVATLESA